jgi:hypothetical protein
VLKEISNRQELAGKRVKVGNGEGSDFVSLFVRRLLIQLNNPEQIIFM